MSLTCELPPPPLSLEARDPRAGATPRPRRFGWRELVVCFALVGVIVALYLPVVSTPHEFLLFDDNAYVTDNPMVRSGITVASLRWAATSVVVDNWHPLTMLSHLLDVELFGLDSRCHHAVNLALHALNGALLFLVLRAMTGCTWRPALVAALFAWHPQRVESVAWIAERKDLLCAAFWFLTLAAYTSYVRRGRWWRYALVALLMTLALLAKPMAVTLPCVLLLLDFWPLARVPVGWWRAATGREAVARLVLEKLPLVALSGLFVATTWATQASRGAVVAGGAWAQVQQSAISYVEYIGKAAWPHPLYLPYLYTDRTYGAAWGYVAIAGLAVVSIAVLAVRGRRYLAVGWLWFLGTLLPVIGLVQVGAQSIADRYTYLPMIGLYIIAAWLAAEVAARSNLARSAVVGFTCVALALCAWSTTRQVPVWRDTSTLFAHALRYSPRNHIAQGAYGSARLVAGDYAGAIEHSQVAYELRPDVVEAAVNLARAHRHLGHTAAAIAWYRRALDARRESVDLQGELARLLATCDDPQFRHPVEAEELAASASIAVDNHDPELLDTLAAALAAQGKFDQACNVAAYALQLARTLQAAGQSDGGALAEAIERRLELYRRGEAYFAPAQAAEL